MAGRPSIDLDSTVPQSAGGQGHQDRTGTKQSTSCSGTANQQGVGYQALGRGLKPLVAGGLNPLVPGARGV